MRAPTYVPTDKLRWARKDGQLFQEPDLRVRCTVDHKVVFDTPADAHRSADNATNRGTPMKVYRGKCGHLHTSRVKSLRRQRQAAKLSNGGR